MATGIDVRIIANPYRGYEARFVWNGLLHRYSFELRTELACMLVDDSVAQIVIDAVMDSLDDLEWGCRPEYPLGVSYVGDSVTSRTRDSAPHSQETSGNPASSTDVEPSPYWEWAAATLKVGAVFGPWALLMILGRMAWGWM